MKLKPVLSATWLLLAISEAAYVQTQSCKGLDDASHHNAAVDISLAQPEDERGRQLTIKIMKSMPKKDCEGLSQKMMVEFDLELLGSPSSEYRVFSNPSCRTMPWSREGETLFTITAAQELHQLYTLSTFHSTIKLLRDDSEDVYGCFQVNVTPSIEPVLSSVLQWTPIAIFLFVLLVEALRTVSHSASSATASLSDEQSDASDDAPRAILHNVADCFNYLQFVFFTGSLSVFYPGFYMPVVSHLSWASLFYTFPTSSDFAYSGVRHGIYEINGTYGGTFGLEVMHQITGAPKTMTTWLNMVLAIITIAVAAAVLRYCIRLLRSRRTANPQFPDADDDGAQDGSTNWGIWILRVIFSFFLMPVAAISFYQFDNAYLSPYYHTILSAGVVCLVLGLFIWALFQIPIRTLGQLIFDRSNHYQRLSMDEDDSQAGYDTMFVWILFILSFIRGATVGGLQISAIAQVVLLATCEVILLISIYSFRAYPVKSVNTISAVVRLITILLMICFIPDLTKRKAKSFVGYIILLLHAGMLVLGFFLPAAVSLWRLCTERFNAPKPDVYSLRQLTRRQLSHTNLSSRLSSVNHGVGYSNASIVSHHQTQCDVPGERFLRSPELGPSTSPNQFFRQPRASSVNRHLPIDVWSIDGTFSRYEPPSSSSSRSTRSFSSRAQINKPYSPDVTKEIIAGRASSLGSFETSGSSGDIQERDRSSNESEQDGEHYSKPLGPRWNDYSFRESDLFYRPPIEGAASSWHKVPGSPVLTSDKPMHTRKESESEGKSQLPSMRTAALGIWSKLSRPRNDAPPERGFQVSRPANLALRPGVQAIPPPKRTPDAERNK